MWPNTFVDAQNYVAVSKGWTHRGSISNTVNGREQSGAEKMGLKSRLEEMWKCTLIFESRGLVGST